MGIKPFRLLVALAVASTSMAALPAAASSTSSSGVLADEPGFLTGPQEGDPDDLAVTYLQGEASTLGLQAADVAELDIRSSYVSRHTGATHVNVNQRFQGLEVFGADTTVTVTADGEIAHVSGSSVAGLEVAATIATAGADEADLDVVEAVEAAADELDLAEPVGLEPQLTTMSGDPDAVVLTDGGISDEPITAKLGWQPTDDGLVLAYQVVIDDNSSDHYWSAIVDADGGELLQLDDWTVHHDHDDVGDMADRLGRGHDHGHDHGHAHAAATPPVVTPNPVIDGSSYNVYAPPVESPNDGGRTLIENPADADASPFGWHDTTGTPEPDFTITRGNNTNTYTDWNTSNNPNNTVLRGVVVDEPSSAAGLYDAVPASFGPVADTGVTGDIVIVDDGSANPTEGCGALVDFPDGAIALVDRGNCPFVDKVANAEAAGAVAVIVANNVAGNPIAMGGSGSFSIASVMISLPDANTLKDGLPATGGFEVEDLGPSQPEGGDDLTFDFPIDLTEHPHEYWEAATTNLFYWCNIAHDVFWHYGFDEPSGNFQHNNYGRGGTGGDAVNCEAQDGQGFNNANFATPAVDGNAPRMQMYLWLGDPVRDGDLENGIILHEYSHGVSFRLTGGLNVNCLSGQQQMGEGWSDYHAIATLIDLEMDDPEEARGMGNYAVRQDDPDRRGGGIRPAPYSRNMDIQPFTYESIQTGAWSNGGSLSQPHGIGHGWAAILWDMTWDLIDIHGFNEDLYGDWTTGGNILSQQLVMDGLKMQGCNPNFVSGRDAIIAADQVLTGGENHCTLWATFSRRGLGYGASSANNNRNSANEAFDTHPACQRDFRAPIAQAYGDLTTRDAGDVVPLRFQTDRRGNDILAPNSPFSRQVSCDTLEVVSEGSTLTPRARPIATETPGRTGLSHNTRGLYHYNWQTEADWAGTCREVVVTLDDGVQHRSFFRFS
jgi:extracellular elastinolytic metalloproteinase